MIIQQLYKKFKYASALGMGNVKPVNLCRKNSTSCLNSSGEKGGGDLDSSITHLAHKLA